MSKYVPDILSRRWVIISEQRIARPNENNKKEKVCPFCPGNEKITPEEVLRYGKGEKNKQGWKLRVFRNKYPITDFHEVIVHSPDCKKDIESLSELQVELIFKAYRQRYNFYKKKGQVLIFCNHGFQAGASLSHPHSQLVVIPNQINLDTLSREPLNNIVEENKYFFVYCPDFSQWPYEVWFTPKKTGSIFGDITDDEIKDFIEIFKKVFRRLVGIYKSHKSNIPFGYNYYIYPKESWYLRLIPRFVKRAGFELGTGLSVNIVDPVNASLEYQGVERDVRAVLKKLKKFK